MKARPNITKLGRIVLGAALFVFAIAPLLGDDNAGPVAEKNEAKNLARTHRGAQIECIMPDGRVLKVAGADERGDSSAALIPANDTLSCPLPEGRSVFIIKLASVAQLDRLTFVNENATAAGALKIAVSNYQLPATSPQWVEVDGEVTFSRKRFFNLSLLGVEARYVKLAFQVTKGGHVAALGLFGDTPLASASRADTHPTCESVGRNQPQPLADRENPIPSVGDAASKFAIIGRSLAIKAGRRT